MRRIPIVWSYAYGINASGQVVGYSRYDTGAYQTSAYLYNSSGTIENSGGRLALLKVGSGQLILSGSDTYSGGTTVDAGTLLATTANAIPYGTSLTVGAGGTFIFDPAPAGGSIEGSSLAASPAGGVAAVPEPSTLALLCIAGIIAAAAWRRRTNRAAL